MAKKKKPTKKKGGRKKVPVCAACADKNHPKCDPSIPCGCGICKRKRTKVVKKRADEQDEAVQQTLAGMEDHRHPKLYPIGKKMLAIIRERKRLKEQLDDLEKQGLEVMRQEKIPRFVFEEVLTVKTKKELKATERKVKPPKKRKRRRS